MELWDWLSSVLAWQGWNGIAAVVALVGVPVIVVSVRQAVAAQSKVDVDYFLFIRDAQYFAASRSYEVDVDLINAGDERAVLMELAVSSGSFDFARSDIHPSMGPGDRARMLIRTVNPYSVWIRIQWVSPLDRHVFRGNWRPLIVVEGLRQAQWIDANNRQPGRWNLPLRLWRKRYPLAIGPGGVAGAKLRASRESARSRERYNRSFPNFPGTDHVWNIHRGISR